MFANGWTSDSGSGEKWDFPDARRARYEWRIVPEADIARTTAAVTAADEVKGYLQLPPRPIYPVPHNASATPMLLDRLGEVGTHELGAALAPICSLAANN